MPKFASPTSALVAFAVAGLSLLAPRAGAATKVVSFDGLAFEDEQMPEGCESAFQDTSRFLSFYESTIASMAARRGPGVDPVVNLFSVSELRAAFQAQFPNLQEESPMDRLLIRQLCTYKQIRNAEFKPGQARTLLQVSSSDAGLHDHLAAISTKLLNDAKQLMLEGIARNAKLKDRAAFTASKLQDIRRARSLGREKVRDLVQ